MADRKVTDTAAAKTLITRGDLSPDMKGFLLANRAEVMKFYNDMMDPEQNAAWNPLDGFDLSDEFKARAFAAFEDAVDVKVGEVVGAIEEQYARLIQERDWLLDYIERECSFEEQEAINTNSLGESQDPQMAKYVDAIRRTSWLTP